MKQRVQILFLILIFIISCRNKNENKTKSVLDVKNNGIAHSKQITKQEKDNYLLDNTSNQDNGPIYMYCEKMPEFIGGETAFIEYLKKNIRYPRQAVLDKIEGRVIVKFVVQVTGKVADVQLIRGVRSDLDKECLRIVSTMPEWKPGMINGLPVAVSNSIPVRFLLNSSENLNGIFILPTKN
jgi:TonB family protein